MAFRLFCKSTCIVESTVACLTVLLWPCVPPSAPCPPEAPRTPFCRAILGRPPTQSTASPTSTAPWPLAMSHIFPTGNMPPKAPPRFPEPWAPCPCCAASPVCRPGRRKKAKTSAPPPSSVRAGTVGGIQPWQVSVPVYIHAQASAASL